MLIRVPSRSIRTQDESFFKELLTDIYILLCKLYNPYDRRTKLVNSGERNEREDTTKQRAEVKKKKG